MEKSEEVLQERLLIRICKPLFIKLILTLMIIRKKEALNPNEVEYCRLINSIIEDYLTCFPNEHEKLTRLRNFVNRGINLTNRKNFDGHLTSSAIVLNQSNEVLLIYHNALGRWLQPGGHINGLELPINAARREVEEETMLRGLVPSRLGKSLVLDIDTHFILENKSKLEDGHLHHDFRHILRTDQEVADINTSEVSDYRWAPLEKAKVFLPYFPWDKLDRLPDFT
jgi:8-oxo-dGTP pyrophosphatase MutT (NUDIX family)